jgi:hypothetical protein
MKSGEQPATGATGAGAGDQKKHPPTGRVEDVVPPMKKPGDQPSPGQSTIK